MSKLSSLRCRVIPLATVLCVGALVLPDQVLGQGIAVTVDNPSFHPVITARIDDPGRFPYQAHFEQKCLTMQCNFTSPAVPNGTRLVVQHVSAFASFANKATRADISLSSQTGALLSDFFAQLTPDGRSAAVDQTVLFYVDAGQTFTAQILADANFGAVGVVALNVTGHLVDCGVIPCGTIYPIHP